MNRRALMRLFGGGAAAATLPPASLGLVMGLAQALPEVDQAEGSVASRNYYHPAFGKAQAMVRAIQRRHYTSMSVTRGEMPPEIAGKRSWSPTFKAHCYDKEREIIDGLDHWLHMDGNERFIEMLARLAGGEE